MSRKRWPGERPTLGLELHLRELPALYDTLLYIFLFLSSHSFCFFLPTSQLTILRHRLVNVYLFIIPCVSLPFPFSFSAAAPAEPNLWVRRTFQAREQGGKKKGEGHGSSHVTCTTTFSTSSSSTTRGYQNNGFRRAGFFISMASSKILEANGSTGTERVLLA